MHIFAVICMLQCHVCLGLLVGIGFVFHSLQSAKN